MENLDISGLDIFKKEEEDMFNLSIKWHHNISLETPIDLVIQVVHERFAGGNYFRIKEAEPATLIINKEDEFSIPYSEFAHMFMPMGYGNDIRADTKEKLVDMFDFSNTDGLLHILSYAGAYEIIGFEDPNEDDCVITTIKEGKLIKIGADKSTIPDGWVSIGNRTYCYSPMSNYIIWGELDSDDIRIIMY